MPKIKVNNDFDIWCQFFRNSRKLYSPFNTFVLLNQLISILIFLPQFQFAALIVYILKWGHFPRNSRLLSRNGLSKLTSLTANWSTEMKLFENGKFWRYFCSMKVKMVSNSWKPGHETLGLILHLVWNYASVFCKVFVVA